MKNNKNMIIAILLMTFSLSFANNVSAVPVQDTDNPVISEVSPPLLFEEGTPGMNVSWTVNDANPDKYLINVSDAIYYGGMLPQNIRTVESGSWTDDQVIVYSVSHFSERYRGLNNWEEGYDVTLIVNDTSGNTATSVAIKVQVKPAPTTTQSTSPGFLTFSSILSLLGVCVYFSNKRK